MAARKKVRAAAAAKRGKMQGKKSKMDQARQIFARTKNPERSKLLPKFEAIGLTKAAAGTYYQTIKTEQGSNKGARASR